MKCNHAEALAAYALLALSDSLKPLLTSSPPAHISPLHPRLRC